MKIVSHENKVAELFQEVVKGQVFRAEDDIFMRTFTVEDCDDDCVTSYNAVGLACGDMCWFDDNTPVEILNNARLILR